MEVKVDTVKIADNHTHVHIIGEVDAYTAPKIRETLMPLCEKKDHVVEVNLKDVQYMDSTGLGIFVGAHKTAVSNEAKLSLSNLTPRVARLFEITGLSDIISVSMPVEQGGIPSERKA